MGAKQTDDSDESQSEIKFQVGSEKTVVLILRPEVLTNRNAILDAILNLSALREAYQLVYLAVPRLVGATLDATVFRTRGIGLLFFDERRIDEAVAPQLSRPVPLTAVVPAPSSEISMELANLRSLYAEMEQNFNRLRDDVKNIHGSREARQELPPLVQPLSDAGSEQLFTRSPVHSGQLPSYFTNNPWLEVLSKRGNGVHEPIAG